MGGFCSNLVCMYMTIWSSVFWGFHGGSAKIVAKMSPKLHFNGGQLEPIAWTDYIQIWFVDAEIHGLVPFVRFMAVALKLATKSPGILSPKLSPRSLRTYLAQISCRVVKRYEIAGFIGFCVKKTEKPQKNKKKNKKKIRKISCCSTLTYLFI